MAMDAGSSSSQENQSSPSYHHESSSSKPQSTGAAIPTGYRPLFGVCHRSLQISPFSDSFHLLSSFPEGYCNFSISYYYYCFFFSLSCCSLFSFQLRMDVSLGLQEKGLKGFESLFNVLDLYI